MNFGPLDAVVLIIFVFFLVFTDYRPSWWHTKRKQMKEILRRKRKDKLTLDDIPGPGPALPILGTGWIFSRFGYYEISHLHEAYKDMYKRYGPVLKEEALWNYPVVSVFNSDAILKVLHYPSKFPLRPPTESIAHYRRSRPDRYVSVGLANEQGVVWHALRSALVPELNSAKTMRHFVPELQQISDEFLHLMKEKVATQKYVDLIQLSQMLGLESTCTLILGRRMGFLEKNLGPLPARLTAVMKDHFVAQRDTYFGLPIWKIIPTSAYKRIVKCEEEYYEIISAMVENALKEEKDYCAVDDIERVFVSILTTPGLDIREKKAGIVDFIAAGIQQISNSIIFILYLLAKHPEVQEKLYEEVKDLSDITVEVLRKLIYSRACIMEMHRLMSTTNVLARILETDMELNGYNVPKGTVVLLQTGIACQEEANFTRATEFTPERWLPGALKFEKSTPALVVPFGYGRRICPGKGFVERILTVTMIKIVQEFCISYDGELDIQFEFLLTPVAPIKFVFQNRH